MMSNIFDVPIKVNINTQVVVRLTERGEKLWAEYWGARWGAQVPPAIREGVTLADGRIKLPLWELMAIFGNGIYMACDIPFVDNEIEIPCRTKLMIEGVC